MFDFVTQELLFAGVCGLVLGVFFGWLFTFLVYRRNAGGASAAQLRAEMEDYREHVNQHFSRTAELFQETTEKYQDLHEHLAGGAQLLCDDLPEHPRAEFKPSQLVTKDDKDALPLEPPRSSL